MKNKKLKFQHIPVLLNESLQFLNIKKEGIYIDGTLGGAGHSKEIIKKLSKNGLLIGIDKDIDAIKKAKEELSNYENIKYINDNHDNIKNILKNLNIQDVDGILLDLGVSSFQIDEETRGFSYMKKSNLDMRMNKSQKLTAEYIVNEYSNEDLANIIYKYGEERFSRKIAKNICEYRLFKKIKTTDELVKIIEKSIPKEKKQKHSHVAKKTFQALRIEVNNEIEPLYNTIIDCINCLKKKGRICVITFHSIEDRIVKQAYLDSVSKCTCPKDLPYCVCNNKSLGIIITKKPIIPREDEIERNKRSKSAKLRVFEKK